MKKYQDSSPLAFKFVILASYFFCCPLRLQILSLKCILKLGSKNKNGLVSMKRVIVAQSCVLSKNCCSKSTKDWLCKFFGNWYSVVSK